MEKIINITIDGDTFLKYKQAYEEIKANKHAIDFGNPQFYSYGWTFYTKDEALTEMAKKFEFIQYKHLEQYKAVISSLEKEIIQLRKQIESLSNG